MSLEGSLDTVALPEVLRLLAGTTKTGELQVSGEPGGGGHLHFSSGRLGGFAVGECRDAADAFFELLRLEHGTFRFRDDRSGAGVADGDAGDGVARAGSLDIEPLLAEASARLEEWHDITAVVPSLDSVVELAPAAPPSGVHLRPDEWSSVVAIGEGRPVRDVLARLGLGEFAGCKALRELVDAAVATVREPDRLDDGRQAFDGLGDADEAAEPAGLADALAEAVDAATPDPASGDELDGDAARNASAEGAGVTDGEIAADAEGAGVTDGGIAAAWEGGPIVASAPDASTSEAAAEDEVGDAGAAAEAGDDPDGAHFSSGDPVARLWATRDGSPADGLTDRGPWTAGELASLDAEEAVADAEGAASETAEAEEPEAAEPAEPEEEPINRGLLLKFLSSVRS